MLTIILPGGIQKEWHVGEKNPINFGETSMISEIQVDGHELQHIQDQYCGQVAAMTTRVYSIPMPSNKRVIRWFGDIAQTIVANL